MSFLARDGVDFQPYIIFARTWGDSMEVLLVEDNPEMLRHIEQSLMGIDSIQSTHKATNQSEGIALLESLRPDLLICDLCLPDGSGIEVVSQSARMEIPSLVISVLCDESTVLRAVESGANGYLLKEVDADTIQSAVLQLLAGGAPITPSIASHILNAVRGEAVLKGQRQSLVIDLTTREFEVLRLVARGFKVAEIAGHLGISEHTVSNHTRAVYRKLRVNSRSQAIYKAFKWGLISD